MTPETIKLIHSPHVKTPRIENPKPGTPQTGEYAFGWGVVKFDWTQKPVLSHNGSNSMNLAKILVDIDNDLGIVVTTNFPEQKADVAAGKWSRPFIEDTLGVDTCGVRLAPRVSLAETLSMTPPVLRRLGEC